MAQYQYHAPPQIYARPEWSHGYPHQQSHMLGPYTSPTPPTVGSASPAATRGPRPSQVRSFGFDAIKTKRSCSSPRAALPLFFSSSFLKSSPRVKMHFYQITDIFSRSTRSFRFPAPNTTSAHVAATRKSNVCTSAVGTAAKRPMVH